MSIIKISLYIFLLILYPLTQLAAQESEEEMRKSAEAFFNNEDYEQAMPVYSQLLSLSVNSTEYNYRFGACQLLASNDKEGGLKYLQFAVKKASEVPLAYFYYGLALHLNYKFDKAIEQYKKYKEFGSKKDKEMGLVDQYIKQCNSGKTLVSNFTDISVVQREVLPRTEFYRNYDLSEFGGKIMVKPEEWMTEEDKKRDAKLLMYFQTGADYVYFASFSDKNASGKDLYVIQKLPTGNWSSPTRLSDVINTAYDEDFPFIHPDGNTLYFASKGHNSMGGYDIFKSNRKGDGTWTEPINMEFAINTPWDEFMFVSDKEEKSAWFASDRETGSKQVTVYRIGIDRVPLDLTLIKGTFDAPDSKKAKITIEDMVQNKIIGVFESDRQFGDYLLDIRGSGKYKFIVEAEDSKLIHTGVVEVPRDKGLKQFTQEMKLISTDGKVQLQIINHFDEPVKENLLTAEVLKKQAILNVNASETDLTRSTEIIDLGAPLADNSGASTEELLASAKIKATAMMKEVKLLNQKATYLHELAAKQPYTSDADALIKAAIAEEIAETYMEEAEKRESAFKQLNATISLVESDQLDQPAKTSQLNRSLSTVNNFKPTDAIESNLTKDYTARINPLMEMAVKKREELYNLEYDINAIDEEVAYYNKEIENTKDPNIKEQLSEQIKEAEKAKPKKEAAARRASIELEVAEKQRDNAEKYIELSNSLRKEATAKAPTVTTTVSSADINQLQTTLTSMAADNPALVAIVTPEQGKISIQTELADSRKNFNSEAAIVDAQTDAGKNPNESPVSAAPRTTIAPDTRTSNTDINDQIRAIETAPSKPDIVNGDYNAKFSNQIFSTSGERDPIIAETKKAEIYDQWVDNIDYRIDSLYELMAINRDERERRKLEDKINQLTLEKEAKEALAMQSYEAIAKLTDEVASQPKKMREPATDTFTEGTTEITSISSKPDLTETSQQTQNSAAVESIGSGNNQPLEENSTTSRNQPVIYSDEAINQINKDFTGRLNEVAQITVEEDRIKESAKLNKEWADALQQQIIALNANIDNTSDIQHKNRLDSKIKELSTLRLEKQNESTALFKQISDKERESVYAKNNQSLQNALTPQLESYNSNVFDQIESQIMEGTDPELQKSQLILLNKNRMLAIQNEELKTENRIKNTEDSNLQADLEEKKLSLASDKLYVQSNLDSLTGRSGFSNGPSAPKTTIISGSEKYEGYIPVASTLPDQYEAQHQNSQSALNDKERELGELNTKLYTTKKKKDKALVQDQLYVEENELNMAEMEANFYKDAAILVAGIEPLLLQLEEGDPTPAEMQQSIALEKTKAADNKTQIAVTMMNDAMAIKNKKARLAAISEAKLAERDAMIARKEAELNNDLAEAIKSVESMAIKENYLIPAGTQIVLPISNRTLNANEQEDVKATSEFNEYALKKMEADSLRNEALFLEKLESRIREESQRTLTQVSAADAATSMKLAQEAFVKYEKADSLSKISARFNRQAAYIENEANRNLLRKPEEVYQNILAYYNSEQASPSISPKDKDDDFKLTPPIENDQQVQIVPDRLSNTIFEVDKNASNSAYSFNNPIPINQPLPNGVIYKVQIGAFRNAIRQDAFKGIKPIVGESTEIGFTRYFAGQFNDFASADFAKDEIRGMGTAYKDAFVVAFVNGKRVSLAQARAQENSALRPNQLSTATSSAQATLTQTAAPLIPSGPPLVQQGPLKIQDIQNQRGVFFTVQVGVFSRPITGADIYNITPLIQEELPGGKFRYSSGVYKNEAQATQARDEIRALGPNVSDAFVTAYKNGQRITMDEARAALGGLLPSAEANTSVSKAKPYTVELGTFSGQIPVNEASIILSLSSDIQKTLNIDGSSTYFFGSFETLEAAESEAKQIRNRGMNRAKAIER